MKYTIYHRNAAVTEGGWSEMAEVNALANARDELKWWPGPLLRHGDLVRVLGGKQDLLYVFDGGPGLLARCPSKFKLHEWEGTEAAADSMLSLCEGVAPKRIVLAACDCADTAMIVVTNDPRPREAIDATRGWCEGRVAASDLLHAARRSVEYAEEVYPEGAREPPDATLQARYEVAYCAYYAASAASSAARVIDNWQGTGGQHRRGVSSSARMVVHYAIASEISRSYRRHFRQFRDALHAMALLVRRRIPLSVAVCAAMGLRDPVPIFETRTNPRGRNRP